MVKRGDSSHTQLVIEYESQVEDEVDLNESRLEYERPTVRLITKKSFNNEIFRKLRKRCGPVDHASPRKMNVSPQSSLKWTPFVLIRYYFTVIY